MVERGRRQARGVGVLDFRQSEIAQKSPCFVVNRAYEDVRLRNVACLVRLSFTATSGHNVCLPLSGLRDRSGDREDTEGRK